MWRVSECARDGVYVIKTFVLLRFTALNPITIDALDVAKKKKKEKTRRNKDIYEYSFMRTKSFNAI